MSKGYWNEVLDDVDAFFAQAGREVKAVTLKAGRTLVLYRHEGKVYCSDVYSTAYKFPLVDAKVLAGGGISGGPAVEVPLDGTLYDLATGKVLKWCPGEGSMVRGLLGRLKRNQVAVNLDVFDTYVAPGGKLWINLAR